ncbi:MAG: hypothetical protein LWX83_14855, partial [Anaerolineae bacterium]|nr:hypothetical protein [Anaerolineae bacterium]
FYLFTILLALLSIAIFQFLTYLMGIAGDFIGVILLMMQLTSSGGSYPKETLPQFFIMISPYLPMTYAVSAFRDIISGNQINVGGVFYGFTLAICVLLLLTVTLKWLLCGGLNNLKLVLPQKAALDERNNSEDDENNPYPQRRLRRLNRASIGRLKLNRGFESLAFKHAGHLKTIRTDGLEKISSHRMKLRSQLQNKAETWKQTFNRRE